ncbi:MAG: DNA gyrase inhibitor YacG [Rhodospirillales bacterium]
MASRKCPTCGKVTRPKFRPFCSRRCADIDLGKWLKEDYRLPSEDETDSDEWDGGENR